MNIIIKKIIRPTAFVTFFLLCAITVIAQDCAQIDFSTSIDGKFVKLLEKSSLPDSANFFWTFGNGKSEHGQEVKVEYEKNGTYQICLKGTSGNCVVSKCRTIIISSAPVDSCKLTITYDYKIDNNTVIVLAKSNLDNTKYLWHVAGQNKTYEGREVKIPFEKAGAYEVCVSTSTSATCKTQTCKRIEVGQSTNTCNLAADFTYTVDSNGVVKLLGKSTAGDTAKYYWSFGNGHAADGREVKFQYEKSGEFQICLKVLKPVTTANTSCSQYICKTVKVTIKNSDCNLKTEIEAKIDGMTAFLYAKSNQDGSKYLWHVAGQNKTYEGREVKIPFEKAGAYEVCVSASTSATCKTQTCKRIEVGQSTNTCNLGADFTYDIEKDIVKVKTISNGNADFNYSWTFNAGISVQAKEVIFQFSKPGDYQLCLNITKIPTTTDDKSCTQTICKKISINNPPITCHLNPDFTFKSEGNTVILTGKSNDEKAKYYWYSKETKTEQTGKDVRFQFEKAASYEICMTVVNGTETCKEQICKKISVGNRINVFPNPTENFLNISVDEPISRVTIYDQFSQVVHTSHIHDAYRNIDIQQLNSGFYTVQVQMENGEVIAKKFYKK